jgi:glutaredoxin|tara:strand:+ start:465 stop:710 length:246 start_codon:yes stop_codon:yes gene_type:complete
MSTAIVWSKNNCIYCTKAKDYLKKKKINIEERNVQSGEWSMTDLQEKVPGARAFPQIFIDGKYVGSYDKMMAHVQMGELSL